MRVVIIGCSKVGEALTRIMCDEGHDVVVVDTDSEKIEYITEKYDCNGFVGNGGSPIILSKAGIDSASLLIAVTKYDETNILCCDVAKKLDVKLTIAAIRTPDYKQESRFLREQMGVDVIVNPEKLAAREVNKLIRYPENIVIERFGDGNVNVATVEVKPGSILSDIKMDSLRNQISAKILVCAIERGNKIITPKGDTVIKANDKITVCAVGEELDTFLSQIGIIEKIIKKIVIIGGSKISYYLTDIMLANGVKVKLVDSDEEKCRELLEKFPKAEVICGDGTDSQFLEKTLAGVDACVAATGDDEENLIISLFAKSFGISRISAKIDNRNYVKMLKTSGINHIFSTQDVAVSGVVRNSRAVSVDDALLRGNSIKWMYKLNDGKVEAVEFEVNDNFKCKGMALMDKEFTIKPGVLIAVIIRNHEAFVPGGASTIEVGDRIIVISSEKKLSDIQDILA